MDSSIIVAILARCAGVAAGAIGAMVTMKGKRLDHDVEQEKLLVGAYEKRSSRPDLSITTISGHSPSPLPGVTSISWLPTQRQS